MRRNSHRKSYSGRRCDQAQDYGYGNYKGKLQIYMRKVAPLGDPVKITVRGYELSCARQMRK